MKEGKKEEVEAAARRSAADKKTNLFLETAFKISDSPLRDEYKYSTTAWDKIIYKRDGFYGQCRPIALARHTMFFPRIVGYVTENGHSGLIS